MIIWINYSNISKNTNSQWKSLYQVSKFIVCFLNWGLFRNFFEVTSFFYSFKQGKKKIKGEEGNKKVGREEEKEKRLESILKITQMDFQDCGLLFYWHWRKEKYEGLSTTEKC